MEPFKNVFSPVLVSWIADHLNRQVPSFDRTRFEHQVLAEIESLELKARAQLIADHVHAAVPEDPGERIEVLRAMLRPLVNGEAEQHSDDSGIGGWGVLPLSMVVGQHGLGAFAPSLALLREMTVRFSSEFAVRYFLLADLPRALTIMQPWVEDPNHHVRRLVSEGTRPRLPWAMQLPELIADPSPMVPTLETLRDDESEYVRRSVANHLNDIAKDHPDTIANLAGEWMVGADAARTRLVRHACRTLIKQGHAGALKAFGLLPPQIELESLNVLTPRVVFGDSLQFAATFRSTSATPQQLVVDYIVHFRKANGQLVGKVFKWKKITLGSRELRSDERSHAIRPITTRRYYAGEQGLSLRINGTDYGNAVFELLME